MDLEDACSNHAFYFEGVEKLLEVSFGVPKDASSDLRKIVRATWEQLLKSVKCEIISQKSNDKVDAFLLSESSMFVFKNRWILKTCGTTTPLHCLKDFLLLAAEAGFDEISELFYSRKNFSRPELQQFPHRGFCEEVEFLDALFPSGRSYCLGSINRECWYLYTFSKYANLNGKLSNGQLMELCAEPDQTIEIIMQELDVQVMQAFTQANSDSAAEATLKTGINKLLPEMLIDDYLFEPCGYSMNGIAKSGEYMTIHITPEEKFSYVSFESNIALKSYNELIGRVVKTFKPGKFLVTIFANKASKAYTNIQELDLDYTKAPHWTRKDMQSCTFPTYNLLFAQFFQKS